MMSADGIPFDEGTSSFSSSSPSSSASPISSSSSLLPSEDLPPLSPNPSAAEEAPVLERPQESPTKPVPQSKPKRKRNPKPNPGPTQDQQPDTKPEPETKPEPDTKSEPEPEPVLTLAERTVHLLPLARELLFKPQDSAEGTASLTRVELAALSCMDSEPGGNDLQAVRTLDQSTSILQEFVEIYDQFLSSLPARDEFVMTAKLVLARGICSAVKPDCLSALATRRDPRAKTTATSVATLLNYFVFIAAEHPSALPVSKEAEPDLDDEMDSRWRFSRMTFHSVFGSAQRSPSVQLLSDSPAALSSSSTFPFPSSPSSSFSYTPAKALVNGSHSLGSGAPPLSQSFTAPSLSPRPPDPGAGTSPRSPRRVSPKSPRQMLDVLVSMRSERGTSSSVMGHGVKDGHLDPMLTRKASLSHSKERRRDFSPSRKKRPQYLSAMSLDVRASSSLIGSFASRSPTIRPKPERMPIPALPVDLSPLRERVTLFLDQASLPPPGQASFLEDASSFSCDAAAITGTLWSSSRCPAILCLPAACDDLLTSTMLDPAFVSEHWLEFLGVYSLYLRLTGEQALAERTTALWRSLHPFPCAVTDLELDIVVPLSNSVATANVVRANPQTTIGEAALQLFGTPTHLRMLRASFGSSVLKPHDTLLQALAQTDLETCLEFMSADRDASGSGREGLPTVASLPLQLEVPQLRQMLKGQPITGPGLAVGNPWKRFKKKDGPSAYDAAVVTLAYDRRNDQKPVRLIGVRLESLAQWLRLLSSVRLLESRPSPFLQSILGLWVTKESRLLLAVEGHHIPLATVLRNAKLTDEILLYIAKRALLALDFLHQQQIIHGAVSEQSFFVTESGLLLLGDHFRAIDLSRLPNPAVRGLDLGSGESLDHCLLKALAPEVLRRHAYTTKADIFSMGMMLLSLGSGGLVGDPTVSVLGSLLHQAYVPAHSLYPILVAPDRPPSLSCIDPILLPSLSLDPDARLAAGQLVAIPCWEREAKPQQFRTICIASQYHRFISPSRHAASIRKEPSK